MPVSGLVFNLGEGPEGKAALAALRARSDLTLGERAGNLVPAALDAVDVRACRDFHEWILSQPGVRFADVVSVNFEGDAPDNNLEQPSAT